MQPEITKALQLIWELKRKIENITKASNGQLLNCFTNRFNKQRCDLNATTNLPKTKVQPVQQ